MSKQDDLNKGTPEVPESGLSRRRFMGAAALAGVAGATGLGTTMMTRESFAAAAETPATRLILGQVSWMSTTASGAVGIRVKCVFWVFRPCAS